MLRPRISCALFMAVCKALFPNQAICYRSLSFYFMVANMGEAPA